MAQKSLVEEMQQVQLAIELIELGARLQVLESETDLSRARLIRLFKEVRGMSPPKGMLPFSTDWFITWLPNVHASLFYNIYRSLLDNQGCERMQAFVTAYRLYHEQVSLDGVEPVLGLTRAWTLVRFFESDLLQLSSCTCCGGVSSPMHTRRNTTTPAESACRRRERARRASGASRSWAKGSTWWCPWFAG